MGTNFHNKFALMRFNYKLNHILIILLVAFVSRSTQRNPQDAKSLFLSWMKEENFKN